MEEQQFRKVPSRRISEKDVQKENLSKTQKQMMSYKSEVTMMKKSVLYQYHKKQNFYDKRSLYIFSGTNPIRKGIVWLVDWRFFEYFILLTIIFNSLSLVTYDYNDRDSLTYRNQLLDIAGYIFTAIFTLECVLKIIAYGFIVHRNSYMRVGWNLIDFAVVVSGQSIFTQAILEQLKSYLFRMKKNISALIQSIPDFLNVVAFLMFIFGLLSILGVYQFQGMYSQYCRINPKPETPTSWAKVPEYAERMCSKNGMGNFVCPGNYTCGSPTDYGIALEHDGLYSNELAYFGIYSFDNAGKALLTIHQMVSVDGWYTYMSNLADTDIPFLGIFYSFIVIIVGSFYLLNLILAVIIQAFIKVQKKEIDEELLKLEEQQKALEQEQDLQQEQHNELNFMQDGQLSQEANQTQKQMIIKNLPSGRSFKIAPLQINTNSNLNPQLGQEHQNTYETSHRLGGESTIQNKLSFLEIKDQVQQNESKVDLSFLKPITTKKKIVNMFQNSLNLTKSINVGELHTEENKEPQKDEIEKITTVQEVPRSINFADMLQQIREKQQEDFKNGKDSDKIDQNFENTSNLVQKAFDNFLEKKKIENMNKQQFFNKVFQEAKENYDQEKQNLKGQNSMRQLATLKLGIKVRRKQTDLSKQFKKFRVEYRAEKNKFYYWCFKIQSSPFFTFFMSCCIIANTIILSMDKYPIEEEQQAIFEDINTAFTVIFVAELAIKLTGLGFKSFFLDEFNTFDSIVVVASVVDLFISNIMTSYNGGAFTALRAFRLLRIFKLAKSWKKLHNLLKTIGRTLKDVSTFSVLLFLFIFIYALLGMELFGYQAKFDEDGNLDLVNGTTVVENFDNFLDAFTTVFIVLTGDSWSTFYFNMYRATNGYAATIFFISLMIIGQKVILNLFLAILLENFDEDSLNQEIKQQFQDQNQEKLSFIENTLSCIMKSIEEYFNLNEKKRNQETLKSKQQNNSSRMTSSLKTNTDVKSASIRGTNDKSVKKSDLGLTFKKIGNDSYLEGRSLWLFGINNKFRQFLFDIVTHNFFEYFINMLIIISSIELALDNPLNDPNGQMQTVLFYIDVVTTSVFSFEAMLKILTFGFTLNGKTSYLRNPWNMLDFSVVILSIISLTPLPSSLKIFKVLRVVRPLRIIGRNQGIKVAVISLTQAVPNIINVSVILLLFFLIFGIICVSYFKGQIYYCDTNDIIDTSELIINHKWDCFNAGGTWFNFFYSFDNIFQAIRMLFLMSTRTGWAKIMYDSVACTEIDYVLIQKNQPYWAIFFIVFILIGSFFLLNLFVGVVISNFNRERDKIGGNNLLTDGQKEWIDTRLLVINSKPEKKLKPPDNQFRKFFFHIQAHKAFDYGIISCITINTIILLLKWEAQPVQMTQVTEGLNFFFTSIFAAEAFIKIIALGAIYFRDSWNIFDFVIAVGSVGSIFVTQYTTVSLGGATTIVRAFRISRVFRLIKSAKSLRLVFNTFTVTLPAMVNVGGLLLLLLYLYSVIGVFLFAEVKRNDLMNDTMNFETFGNAFISLFVIATGDSWDYIVEAAIKQRSIVFQCINDPSYEDFKNNGYETIGCGPGIEAHLFFYSFILIVALIYLNLFIAIILQGYEDSQNKESRLFNNETLQHFRKVWADFDPEATSFIPIKQLRPLLFKLGSPLGWDKSYDGSKMKQDKYMITLNLPTYNDFSDYQFLDVLDALSLRLVVSENFKKEQEKLDKSDDIVSEESPTRVKNSLKKTMSQKQETFKHQFEQEINLLKFQEDAMEIEAVQQVEQREKQMKMKKSTNQVQQDQFSSLHQAAAEVAFNHMRYIVAKRKLMRKMDNLEEKDLENIDQAMRQSGVNFKKENKQPILQIKKILSKRIDEQQDNESDRIIEELADSNAQARNSINLMRIQSISKMDAKNKKSPQQQQQPSNESFDKRSSWANSPVKQSNIEEEEIKEDNFHYDINKHLVRARMQSLRKHNKVAPMLIEVQQPSSNLRRVSEISNKQQNMSMGGTGEQVTLSDEEEKIDGFNTGRLPSIIVENNADSFISNLQELGNQQEEGEEDEIEESKTQEQAAFQIQLNKVLSQRHTLRYLDDIENAENPIQLDQVKNEIANNESLMLEIEAAFRINSQYTPSKSNESSFNNTNPQNLSVIEKELNSIR